MKRGAAARVVDLDRCEGLTLRRRLRDALLAMLVGIVIAGVASALYVQRAFDPEIRLLEPARYRSETLTVWRFRFAHVGGESSCFATLYHELQTWTVEC